jgi:hypothetical protein
MKDELRLCFFALTVFVVGTFSGLLWLTVVLILQTIVDRVILQDSAESLPILRISLFMLLTIASFTEIGRDMLGSCLIQRTSNAKSRVVLALSSRLGCILPATSLLFVYSSVLAFMALVVSLTAGIALSLCRRYHSLNRHWSGPLPLLFRLPLVLIIALVLLMGTAQVLAKSLSIGQWIAIGILTLQLSSSILIFSMSPFERVAPKS